MSRNAKKMEQDRIEKIGTFAGNARDLAAYGMNTFANTAKVSSSISGGLVDGADGIKRIASEYGKSVVDSIVDGREISAFNRRAEKAEAETDALDKEAILVEKRMYLQDLRDKEAKREKEAKIKKEALKTADVKTADVKEKEPVETADVKTADVKN